MRFRAFFTIVFMSLFASVSIAYLNQKQELPILNLKEDQGFFNQKQETPRLIPNEEGVDISSKHVHRVLVYSHQKPHNQNFNKIASKEPELYNKPLIGRSSSSLQDNISRLRELRLHPSRGDIEKENSFSSFTSGDLATPFTGSSFTSSTTMSTLFGKSPNSQQCPVCYKLVEQEALDRRAQLNRLLAQLADIEQRAEVVDDISFQLRLRELAAEVDSLLRDAQFAKGEEQAIVQQLHELRLRVAKVAAIRDSITQIGFIEITLKHASGNATHVQQLIERVTGGVVDARAYLDKQAGGALMSAWDRSKQFGQQSERLSELARESRLLAESHSADSSEIVRLASESLNTSQIAYRIAKEAISTQEGNKKSMEKLRRQMKSTEDLLLKTVRIAQDAQKEALRTYNDALDIYSKSAPSMPALRAEKVNQDAAWVISHSLKIIAEVERLLNQYEVSTGGAQKKLDDAKNLLQQAQELQSETDRLLEETQRNLARARAAIESGESTLKEAQNTLATLREFDQLVGKSKAKAEEALSKVQEIHNLIKEAELKTDQAEKALKGALQDAQEARDIAAEAHRIAERASMQVRKLKEGALGLKNKASELKKRLDLFNVRIEESSTKIIQCEGDSTQDSRAVKDTLEKANQAKNLASEALKKIQSAINTLDSILEELESLDQVDGSLLEELFQRLAKAEQEYREAELDNRANNLLEARDQQRKWLADYERIIAKLIADVNNVDKIRQALPDKCYRRIRLEP